MNIIIIINSVIILDKLDMSQIDTWHFPRTEQANMLITALESGITNHLTLFAPRRMGKTEFLLQDLMPIAQKKNYIIIYINLWSEQEDPGLVIVQKLYEAILELNNRKHSLIKMLEPELKKIYMKGTLPFLGEIGTEVEFKKKKDPDAIGTINLNLLIDKLLQVLVDLAKNRTPLILLDEVQHLASHKKFLPLTAALRTALDTRKVKVKVIFTGSSRQGLLRMFNDSKAPFFNMSVNVPFPTLDIKFVEFILKKYYQITKKKLDLKLALQFFEKLHFNPFYFRNLIMKCLFHSMNLNDAYPLIESEISEENNFQGIWSRLDTLEQMVFMEIIANRNLYSVETLKTFSELIGEKITTQKVQTSLNRLIKLNLIGLEGRASYFCENDLFSDWVKINKL